MQRTKTLSMKEFRQFVEALIHNYCKNPLYWAIDERPVCSVLNLTDFVFYYGLRRFGLMLLYMRKLMAETLGVEPYLIGLFSEANRRNVYIANQLPLDAATGYALLPDWRGPHVQQYKDLIERRVKEWYAVQEQLRIPFFPVASVGWDASVRGQHLPKLSASRGFPWTPIVTGVTPELFGYFIDQAAEFNLNEHPDKNIIFIHAWNEWTESSSVEPSDRFGTRMLEEIRKRSGNFSHIGQLEKDKRNNQKKSVIS